MTAKGKTCTKEKLILGVGINDAPFATQRNPYTDENGVNHPKWTHPVYVYWTGMLDRTHSKLYHNMFPTYADVKMQESWKRFTNFYSWIEDKDFSTGKVLDKDILGDGKLYSEDTCCLVDSRINGFVIGEDRVGIYPKGLSYDKKAGKFISKISINCKRKSLGRYANMWEGHLVYRKAKLEHAYNLIDECSVEDYIASALIAKLQKKVDEAEILYQQSLI